jgi:siroheme synthase
MVCGPIAQLPELADQYQLTHPSIIIIGMVAGLAAVENAKATLPLKAVG